MARSIIALYDDLTTAQRVVEELVKIGVDRSNISIVANDASGEYATRIQSGDHTDDDVHSGEGASFGAVIGAMVGLGAMLIPGIGPVIAAGPLVAGLVGAGVGAATGAITGGITASLVKLGVDEEQASYYAEGIRRGGTLVTAHVDDDWNDRVLEIMNRNNPVDVKTRAQDWRAGGWQGFDASSTKDYKATDLQRERQSSKNVDDQARLEVVEEELKVGKREVDRGGVRVTSYVTEKPVEEQVRLREERVQVERHPVDRKATDADFAKGDEAYELHERAEEAVINKEARVVEEVVVKKDVQERTETVRDTVRRKDVNVEQMGTTGSSTSSFEDYDNTFRTHYNSNLANTGNDYSYYTPAYQFGYTLANDPRYRDYDWNRVESEARTRWEERNRGTWDRIKDAVRNAWENVKDAAD